MKKRTIFKKQNFSFLGYQVKEAYVLAIELKPTRNLILSLISRNEKLVYNLRYSGDHQQAPFLHEYLRRLRKCIMRNAFDAPIVQEHKVVKTIGFIIWRAKSLPAITNNWKLGKEKKVQNIYFNRAEIISRQLFINCAVLS